MIDIYIQRENRSETLPQPNEVNCHKEAVKMIGNIEKQIINHSFEITFR